MRYRGWRLPFADKPIPIAAKSKKRKRYPDAAIAAIPCFMPVECGGDSDGGIGAGSYATDLHLGIYGAVSVAAGFAEKTAFRFHACPLLPAAGIAVLFNGHAMIDWKPGHCGLGRFGAEYVIRTGR